MTKNEAREILKSYNAWRRDFRTGKMQSVFDVGKAMDVLCEPPAISQALRDAAVNWPQFLSDEDSAVVFAFFGDMGRIEGARERWRFMNGLHGSDSVEKLQSLTFMLFVTEALE